MEVLVPSQESGRSCVSVIGSSMLSLSTIVLLDFGIVQTVWYLLFSILLLLIFMQMQLKK